MTAIDSPDPLQPRPGPAMPGRYRSGRPDLRIGDAERTEACESLTRHFTAGRLDHEELDKRLSAAMAARTDAELRRLFADLPQLPPRTPPQRPAPRRDVTPVLLGIPGLLAIPVVLVMLFGSLFMGPGVFMFSLIGGCLAAYSGAALTRLAMGVRPVRPPRGQRAAVSSRNSSITGISTSGRVCGIRSDSVSSGTPDR